MFVPRMYMYAPPVNAWFGRLVIDVLLAFWLPNVMLAFCAPEQ